MAKRPVKVPRLLRLVKGNLQRLPLLDGQTLCRGLTLSMKLFFQRLMSARGEDFGLLGLRVFTHACYVRGWTRKQASAIMLAMETRPISVELSDEAAKR